MTVSGPNGWSELSSIKSISPLLHWSSFFLHHFFFFLACLTSYSPSFLPCPCLLSIQPSFSALSLSLSLISPLQPFSGFYREESNLRFILPPISNLRNPCCWRRIFSGLDVSCPVKLKSVKKWQNISMAPCVSRNKSKTPSVFCRHSSVWHRLSGFRALRRRSCYCRLPAI